MLSLTSEYALRAMICLARHWDEWPITGRTIAEEAKIPRKYLSFILGALVRAGLLGGSPGKGGGFHMVRSPAEITLAEVFAPFEPSIGKRRPCPFGNEECNDDDPCAGHERWKKVRETYSHFLQQTSVYDVAVKSCKKRRTKK